MFLKRTGLAVAVLLSFAAAVRAEDAYYRLQLKDLEITEGKLPATAADVAQAYGWGNWRTAEAVRPYAVLNGKGEVYLRSVNRVFGAAPTVSGDPNSDADAATAGLFIRAPQGTDVSGLIFLRKTAAENGPLPPPKPGENGMVRLKFKVSAKLANDKFAKDFYQQKANYYQAILDEGIPGGAWFRHELRSADRELGKIPGAEIRARNQVGNSMSDFEDTFDLFSGGRALAENLQLDRAMPAAKEQVATVDVSTLEGISVAEIDWKKLTKAGAQPALDPLAAAIPADQHAIFFPTFAKLMEVADHLDEQGTRVLNLASPRSEDARTKERYERQLCLSTSALSRLLGPALVKSVAITGSDPYFVSGTDVAVLFEAANPPALQALIAARIAVGAATTSAAKAVDGQIDGVAYGGFRSPDRAVSSYVARIGDVIIVTNSLAQLTQLVKVHAGKLPAIASLPEYGFFRTRYVRGAAEESALLFLSDATIRRWCSARWRIASSRRVCDQALMSELQATYLDDLVHGHVEAGPIHTDLAAGDAGELRLTASGVTSSVLGSLDFQTPIVEMPLEKVTQQEADFYKRWRDTYQQNWRWGFDPIALRITANDKQLAGDLSVMPLILNTEYRQFLSFTQGAEIKPAAGDPHDALLHWIVAFNREAPDVRQASNMVEAMMSGAASPLSWVGSSIAVYADDDPFWEELAKLPDETAREKFFEQNFARLPIAVNIAVASPLKLTAFLVTVRGMVEQTAPGMVVWESQTYHDQPYVKISPTERAKGELQAELPPGTKEPALYYAITSDALLVTLNEAVLKRALDRAATRHKAKADDAKPLPTSQIPWLGSSVCLRVDGRAIGMFGNLFRDDYENELRLHAWNNLPILNEWKRRYPDQDPVAIHEKFFQTRLICPGGGKYVWNEEWHTMESTLYGHPGQPKKGPEVPFLLSSFSDLDFGLTFEDKGLRARLNLGRVPEKSGK